MRVQGTVLGNMRSQRLITLTLIIFETQGLKAYIRRTGGNSSQVITRGITATTFRDVSARTIALHTHCTILLLTIDLDGTGLLHQYRLSTKATFSPCIMYVGQIRRERRIPFIQGNVSCPGADAASQLLEGQLANQASLAIGKVLSTPPLPSRYYCAGMYHQSKVSDSSPASSNGQTF